MATKKANRKQGTAARQDARQRLAKQLREYCIDAHILDDGGKITEAVEALTAALGKADEVQFHAIMDYLERGMAEAVQWEDIQRGDKDALQEAIKTQRAILRRNIMDWHAGLITAESIPQQARGIAIRAMKTILARMGSSDGRRRHSGGSASATAYAYMCRLYADVCAARGDGQDIIQTAAAFLCEYIGRRLSDIISTDKRGKTITVLRAAFRAVNRYIMGQRQRVYKTVALQDLGGAYITPPPRWDVDNIHDFKRLKAIIKRLGLSGAERRALDKRMGGLSRNQIAAAMGVSRGYVNVILSRIAKKAEKIGLAPKK